MNTLSFHGFSFSTSHKASQEAAPEDIIACLALLKPQPSPFRLIRVGGSRDGAYLLPDDLHGVQACFSPGVNNTKQFEDELVDRYGICCHLCDASSDVEKFATPLKQGSQIFMKRWLDVEGVENSISLKDWVSEAHGVGECPDLILQMDIEGAEYRNLLTVPIETLHRFRIIVIEFHDMSAIKRQAVMTEVMRPLFRKLNALFMPVHVHPNNCCGDFSVPRTTMRVPEVIEVTYLHRGRLDTRCGQAGSLLKPLCPHPLDIVNFPQWPALHLSRQWLNGPRPLRSRLKICADIYLLPFRLWLKGLNSRLTMKLALRTRLARISRKCGRQ